MHPQKEHTNMLAPASLIVVSVERENPRWGSLGLLGPSGRRLSEYLGRLFLKVVVEHFLQCALGLGLAVRYSSVGVGVTTSARDSALPRSSKDLQ